MAYDTLNLFPVELVEETWEWKTDILVKTSGKEQRISLREDPRITLSTSLFLGNSAEGKDFKDFVLEKMKNVHNCPQWHKAVKVEQASTAGTFKIYFPTEYTPFRADDIVSVLNLTTTSVTNYTVDTVDADGINVTVGLEEEINKRHLIMPCLASYIDVNASLRLGYVADDASVTIKSIEEPTFLYPDDNYTLVTLEDIPVITELFEGDSDGFVFDYEILDGGVGKREFRTAWDTVHMKGQRSFFVDKTDPQKMSFWRTLFSELRGAWKPVFLSSQKNDYSKVEGPYFSALPEEDFLIVSRTRVFSDETYSFINVYYDDKDFTSQHRIVSDEPYVVISEPEVNKITATPRFFKLTDLPGVTEAMIDAGLVTFRVNVDVTNTFTAVNPGDPAQMNTFINFQYRDENFDTSLTAGWIGGETDSTLGGAPVQADLLAPPGSRYMEYDIQVQTALVAQSEFTFNSHSVGLVIDGVFNDIGDLYDYRLITIDPPLPNDVRVGEQEANGARTGIIPKISQLLKCRLGDSVQISHGAFDALVKISYQTTNEG